MIKEKKKITIKLLHTNNNYMINDKRVRKNQLNFYFLIIIIIMIMINDNNEREKKTIKEKITIKFLPTIKNNNNKNNK